MFLLCDYLQDLEGKPTLAFNLFNALFEYMLSMMCELFIDWMPGIFKTREQCEENITVSSANFHFSAKNVWYLGNLHVLSSRNQWSLEYLQTWGSD